ncbi:MAG: hypothetical protein ABIF08_04045 [Nanoarchaeota archaeon]
MLRINTVNKITSAVIASITALGLATSKPAFASDNESKIELGYNALETGVSEDYARNRLFTNATVEINGWEVGFQGLNEINDLDFDTYFGRNRLYLGPEDSENYLLIDTIANSGGIIDTRYGIRNMSLMRYLGGYGYVDMETNKDLVGINAFYGKPVKEGSLEILQSVNFPFQARPNYYTELQFNRAIDGNPDYNGFFRIEMSNFDVKDSTYLIGLTYNLGN